MNLTENSPLGSGSSSIKIATEVSTLCLKIYGLSANFANPAALISALSATFITVEKQTKSELFVRINNRPIMDIAEIAASLNSAVIGKTSGGVTSLQFTIDLAKNGNVKLLVDEYLNLKFVAVPANVSIVVDAIEMPMRGLVEYQYTTAKTFSDAPSLTVVDNVVRVALPVANLRRLTTTIGSKTTIREKEEIEQTCNKENTVSFLLDGLVTVGFKTFYCLRTEQLTSVKHEATADQTIYLLREHINF